MEDNGTKELKRYKLIVSYDGTNYKGFQRQSSSSSSSSSCSTAIETCNITDNHVPIRVLGKRPRSNKINFRKIVPPTVQEVLEDAIEFYTDLDRQTHKVRFAGRTDSGVHARGQVLAVFLPPITINSNCSSEGDDEEEKNWQIRRAINSRLPNDISIDLVSPCHEIFDPRLDAIRKQYSYLLRYREKVVVITSSSGIGKGNEEENILPICAKGGPHLLRNALDSNFLWICPWALDSSKIKRCCELLTGTHDYSAFVHKKARETRDNRMTVNRFDFERKKLEDSTAPVWEVRFLVEAKGFGRSQVRNMIGFLVDCCRGTIKDQESSSDWIWMDPNQLSKQINSAPACGLCLEHVIY